VITSHDPQAALAEADLALGLRDGRPMFTLPAGEVTSEDMRELYA
jgi:ABC-type phosphate/phosphonate transport system ATPase subunit